MTYEALIGVPGTWLAPTCHPSILSYKEGEKNLKWLKGKAVQPQIYL